MSRYYIDFRVCYKASGVYLIHVYTGMYMYIPVCTCMYQYVPS